MPTACVDTNIWFYALARPAEGEQAKHLTARELIGALEQPVITPQIVNELSANLLRKRGWGEPELRALIGDLCSRCRLFIPGADWHEEASHLRERHGLSFWDGLVVVSARAAGCEVLFSEDMHHGLRIDSLDILNPFASE
jgi:predicted nucleic acid-binding protein